MLVVEAEKTFKKWGEKRVPYVHDRCQKTNTRERDIPMTDELRSVLLE